MSALLRRLFIPIVIGLACLALYLYFAYDHAGRPHDIREAVPIEHFKLNNGMTVVVMPNHRVPVVTHMLLVKAGGGDDPYGKSGLAHYLEHLMFTGSKNYEEGVYDRTIARVGGVQNAYTTKDYTLFYATVAAEQLPSVMAMESDRLQNLLFDPAHVARELKVITEERNQRVENNAAAQLEEQLDALSYLNHPYHHPTIGWAEDMAGLSAEDAKAFFAANYRASNMVLIVAGDVGTSDVRRYAQHYYDALAGGAMAPRNWPHEPPLRLERHATMHDAKVHEPRLVRQYLAPSVVEGATAQALPLSLLAQYLGGGQSSFLFERLVRDQKLASSVDVSYDPFALGPPLFRIELVPAPGVSLEQLEQALDGALAQLAAGMPEDAAFKRAQVQLKAEVTYAQDGLSSLAEVIGSLYALGLDEQYFYEWPAAIEHITAADMHAAQVSVLAPAKRVTGYLLPQAAPVAGMEAAPSALAVPSAAAAPIAPAMPGTEAVHVP